MPCTRRVLALLALLVAALAPAPPAAAQSEDAKLKSVLTREMRGAAAASGAYVVNADDDRVLFGWRSATKRILASNTKLFTNGAALAANGPGARFETEVLGVGAIEPATGIFPGDLYLRGAGDPSFGSSAYNRDRYAGGADAEVLADELHDLGLRRVRGRIVGDESLFDRLRGTAYSGYGGSAAIGGPLTALAYNHGRASNGRFQTNPPVYAAGRFAEALRRRGIRVDGAAAAGSTPESALELAQVEGPTMTRLAQITGVRSENWFSEMLLKGLTVSGTTRHGAAQARRFARSLGASVSVVDGSGLSRSNKASPREVVDFLLGELEQPEADAFVGSLPTAGVSGTLATRMRRGPARGRCRAKTGTINGVTTLSGYCDTAGGDTLAFSILMNDASVGPGRSRQDRMVQAIARYRG
ncbi:MAG TPA: D-alanyl-D-alanine carboxypeptidase [Thermoleophilaceae bacterium]|nr:D-alanyl-D-alanine carboxypeptidase [Thermoleophilaceae bacterium]